MDISKLMFIKRCQREYQERFNEKLEIDWSAMADEVVIKNNDKDEALSKLEELCERYKASVSNIRNKRINPRKFPAETAALVDWCKWIKDNNFILDTASKIINKDRTLIYYYANQKSKQETTRKK